MLTLLKIVIVAGLALLSLAKTKTIAQQNRYKQQSQAMLREIPTCDREDSLKYAKEESTLSTSAASRRVCTRE
jgi:hypothetical protein